MKINQTISANGKPNEQSKSRAETGIEEEKSKSIPVFVCGKCLDGVGEAGRGKRGKTVCGLTDWAVGIKLYDI